MLGCAKLEEPQTSLKPAGHCCQVAINRPTPPAPSSGPPRLHPSTYQHSPKPGNHLHILMMSGAQITVQCATTHDPLSKLHIPKITIKCQVFINPPRCTHPATVPPSPMRVPGHHIVPVRGILHGGGRLATRQPELLQELVHADLYSKALHNTACSSAAGQGATRHRKS